MLKDLTIPNCHGLRMPRSRNMPIPKATSGPFCSRFDPHKTKMEDQAATDRSVDIEGRGCKAVSGNCCAEWTGFDHSRAIVFVTGLTKSGNTHRYSSLDGSVQPCVLLVCQDAVLVALVLESTGATSHANSSNNALASCKSAVSNPSVNQLYTGASRSWASWRFPCCCQSRARLVAARSSQDFADWFWAIAMA